MVATLHRTPGAFPPQRFYFYFGKMQKKPKNKKKNTELQHVEIYWRSALVCGQLAPKVWDSEHHGAHPGRFLRRAHPILPQTPHLLQLPWSGHLEAFHPSFSALLGTSG